jgi:16S rRNA (uracil1498-N3)-methyltransferase
MSKPPPLTASAPAQDASTQDPAPPSIRLHVPAALAEGVQLPLDAAQAHYLGNVMRRGRGDRVLLFNGADGEHLATITDLKRDRCSVAVGPQTRPQTPEPDLWLAFALLKRGPTELIVQKATELGVSALLPVFTTRTNADRTNLARLQAIATEAAEQSERLCVPAVHPPRALNALLATWPANRTLVACFERGADAPIRRLPSTAATPLGLLIGPEGGFTDAELDAVRAHPFVEPVTLGPRILRADTASIVGLALLQAV